MSNVIVFKPTPRNRNASTTDRVSSGHPSAQPSPPVTFGSPDLLTANKLNKINELEDELLTIIDEYSLRDQFECKIHEREIEDLPGKKLPELEDLEEIVVFSPEIQQEGFSESSSDEETVVPASWGDVFVKVGDEYPFLFTVYTASYASNQLLRYGEKISHSSRDIILSRKQLQREDLIRAVIKWINLYRPSLSGRPIRLECESILQTLVCDPFVEIQCPDTTF